MDEVEELRRRVAMAERVCVLFGWTGTSRGLSDRYKAAVQAWQEWHSAYGPIADVPTDADVLELAARRDVRRNVTLMRIRSEREETDG